MADSPPAAHAVIAETPPAAHAVTAESPPALALLRAQALRLLSQREYSRQELARKLRQWLARSPVARRAGLSGSAGDNPFAGARGADAAPPVRGGPQAGGGLCAEEAAAGGRPAAQEVVVEDATGQDALGEGAASAAEALIATVVDDLAGRGWQSDARTAQTLLGGRGKGWGSLRLRHALREKGLAPELMVATLQQAQEQEVQRARQVWQRRFGTPAESPQERARQARFLAARGFPHAVVRQVVRGLPEDSSDDPSDGCA